MKRIAIFVTLIFLLELNLFSQNCLPQGIQFTTQDEIDNFQINYPNCIEIEGNVDIINSNIANLNGLNVVETIGGSLIIENNPDLISLAGLSNLAYIGGDLSIGDFNFGGNQSLTNLSGLENITHIGGDLNIRYNDVLVNLNGLNNLTSIGGNLEISDNALLESLEELSNLTTIGGYLMIKYNSILTNLTGLDNVTSIGWDLSVMYNYALTSLTGLENIDPTSIYYLYIYENTILSDCAAKTICDYIEYSPSTSIVQFNNSGCNSLVEIEEACDENGFQDLYMENRIRIYPNPAKEQIIISSKNGLEISEVIIYNQVGQNILHENQVFSSIDISHFKQGMYVIEVVTKKLKIRDKLIVR